MTSLLDVLRSRTPSGPARSMPLFGGWPLDLGLSTTWSPEQETIPEDFRSYVEHGYKRNGVIFAVMLARHLLFSEARFAWRDVDTREVTSGTADGLTILRKPWPNGTTGELLARMEQDASLAGNFYAIKDGNRIRRMRPDWVTIVLGSKTDGDHAADQLDVDVAGYAYTPGGGRVGERSRLLLPDEVVHYSPIPDPLAHYRGMSWLTPVVREVAADSAATSHKLKFFENAATPNLSVSLSDKVTPTQFSEFVEMMDEQHDGLRDAYKTLYLGGGADVTVVGADMKQLDFKLTQGAGETRIAAAGGVPPVIVGLSEGLQAATYSNYSQARRRFADGTIRPLWRMAAASLAPLIRGKANAELWYDDRDIAFLQEDQKDAVTIVQGEMAAIRQGIEAGFDPDDVVQAVQTLDVSKLTGKHTGLTSVQLQQPASGDQPAPPAPDGDDLDDTQEDDDG